MAARDERVIVVGGGIGGMSAVRGLHRAGVPVAAFEQAPELTEAGAGIQLWVDGMKALRGLDAVERVRANSGRLECLEFRSWRGSVLSVQPIAQMCQETGAENPVMVRRHTLLDALADGLPDGVVELGRRCEGFSQDDRGVTVRFADGSEERGAVLVGFDGINSVIRRQQFGEKVKPRFAGYQYLRGVTRYDKPDLPPHHQSFTFGRGDRFGIGGLGGGWIYWFAVLTYPKPGAQDPPEGRKAEVMRRFKDFAAPIPDVIAATPEEAILRNDIYALPPLEQWTAGRVAIAGDAAHATTPNLGRGASMAMMDSWTLSRRIAEAKDLADLNRVRAALQAYEDERRPETAKIQRMSWRIGAMANWSNPVKVRIREKAMRVVMSRGMAKSWRQEFVDYRVNEPPAVNQTP